MERTLKSTYDTPALTREDKIMLIARTAIENLEPGDLGAFLALLLVGSIEKLTDTALNARYLAAVEHRASNPDQFDETLSGKETTEEILVDLLLERKVPVSGSDGNEESDDDETVAALSSSN